MRAKKWTYWVATILVCFVMTVSGMMAVIHWPAMMIALAHLGYPAYFANLLGVAKLMGVCVLLAPGWPRLKEWAYVGFGITLLSASYSHLLSGDGLLRSPEPLITLAVLAVSYWARPFDRRFSFSADASPSRVSISNTKSVMRRSAR